MFKDSITYSLAGLIRFAFLIYITLRTLEMLSVEEYAYFGIANVVTMLFGILWFANIDSSFQKLYSKRLINKSVNFVILITTTLFTFSMLIVSTLIFFFLKNTEYMVQALTVIEAHYFPIYCLMIALNSYILSILNAKQKSKEYFLQMTFPVICLALYLFISTDVTLSTLFLVHALSIGSSIILIVFFNSSALRKSNYSCKHVKYIFMYMMSYTYTSIPTLASKYTLDLVIRGVILGRFGYLELSAYNLCQSLLNIFRSFEQSIARALTPYLLRQVRYIPSELSFARNIILVQTAITIITLLSSFIWMPALMKVIPSKPADVFDSVMLIMLGAILISGYWKNYSLMHMKKFSRTMKLLYNQTTVINLLLMLVFGLLHLDLYSLLFTQFCILIMHNFLLRRIVKRLLIS